MSSFVAKCIVIEIGQTFIRGGRAGMHCPRFISDSDGLLDIKDERDLSVKVIELFQEIFQNRLHCKAKEYSVLLIDKVTMNQSIIDVFLTILLKVFQVRSVSVQPDLFLASIASGVNTGIIMNIGEKESQAICVAQGLPLLHTFRTATVGVTNAIVSFNHLLKDELEGLDLLMKQMDTDGDGDLSPEELQNAVEATRPVFEKVACCNLKDKKCADLVVYPAQNVANEPFTIESKFRHLPLEVIITGVSDAEGCADENGGTAGLLLECLAACNHDVRAVAAGHIVICGGGATIPGLPAAICHAASERTGAASSNSRVRGLQDVVRKLPGGKLHPLPSPFVRSSMSWIGGSIFASLKDNAARFVKLSDLTGRERPGGTSGNGGIFFVAPNWQSLDSTAWSFWGPCAALGPADEEKGQAASDCDSHSVHSHQKSIRSEGGKAYHSNSTARQLKMSAQVLTSHQRMEMPSGSEDGAMLEAPHAQRRISGV